MDHETTTVRARKREEEHGKLHHITITPGERGHVLEEHHESHGMPSEVKIHAFSDSPEDAKRMVKHVINRLDLPLDADDGEKGEDEDNDNEEE